MVGELPGGRVGLVAHRLRERAAVLCGASPRNPERRGNVGNVSPMVQDVRYAFRLLARTPGFTLAAIVVLALGIGANTAVFSIVNTLLFKPVPGREGAPLVGVYARDRKAGDTYRSFSWTTFDALRSRTDLHEGLAAHGLTLVGLGDAQQVRRVFGSLVSSNYFSVMGAPVAAGRTFTPEEDRPGADVPVVVVAHQFWTRLGADAGMLGRTIRLNGRDFTVVGVAPEGFGGTSAVLAIDVFLPLGVWESMTPDLMRDSGGKRLDDPANRTLMLVARLYPGAVAKDIDRRLDDAAAALAADSPDVRDDTFVTHTLPRFSIATSPHDERELTLVSTLLIAMSSGVLLVACLNLANMLLARGAARRREIAIRLAIGGGRARIVRQLLVEGLVLSLGGAAAGLVLSTWAMRGLVASLVAAAPVNVRFDVAPDWRVLAATGVFAALCTVAFGLGPAWKLTRGSFGRDLKEQTATAFGNERRRRLFSPVNMLVMSQVGLSLALLTAGGLFVRSAINAAGADPGVRLEGGILAEVDSSLGGRDEASTRALYTTLLARLRGLPGVESVSMASLVPFGDVTEMRPVASTLASPAGQPPRVDAHSFIVGRDYFRTIGLHVLRGRDFSEAEEQGPSGLRPVIVDQTLVERLWKDRDPIGQQLWVLDRNRKAGDPMQVVGVVSSMKHQLIDAGPEAHYYVPFGSAYRPAMTIHVRSAAAGGAAEQALLARIREEMKAVDATLPVVRLRTFTAHRDASLLLWLMRTAANLFTSFGVIALVLAVSGVYAVKAYVVARRTREIGIRMALGASQRDVLWMVLREGLTLAGVGLVAGGALGAGLSFVLRRLLYQVGALDPVTFAVAPLALGLAAAVACYLPARRAMRIEPVRALRTE